MQRGGFRFRFMKSRLKSAMRQLLILSLSVIISIFVYSFVLGYSIPSLFLSFFVGRGK